MTSQNGKGGWLQDLCIMLGMHHRLAAHFGAPSGFDVAPLSAYSRDKITAAIHDAGGPTPSLAKSLPNSCSASGRIWPHSGLKDKNFARWLVIVVNGKVTQHQIGDRQARGSAA